ncbi:hypothetical protein T484DRAFT_1894367 [Baffinella frigidus]|nr:hypothetical protein T484DRAFT_1894367 [Cryptophyta sp. CCMP2293]
MRVFLLLAWAASASAFAFTPSALSPTRSLPAMASAGRPARLALRQGSSAAKMMGPGAPQTEFASGKEMPFTLEMRNAAMALHTFSQAPKQGKVKDQSANTQVEQWQASQEDYLNFLIDSKEDHLNFLIDSKVVYQSFEDVANANEDLALFRNTGT